MQFYKLDFALKWIVQFNITYCFQENTQICIIPNIVITLLKITCYFSDSPEDIQFLWVYSFNCIVRIPRKSNMDLAKFM